MINEEVKENWGEYHYPTNYFVRNGILYIVQNDENKFVCGTPFVFVGKTPEISTGARFYMIRYGFDKEVKELLIKSTDLQTKKRCAEILSGHAFVLNDGRDFSRVTKYILDCQLEYGAALKTIYATESNGWNEEGTVFAIGREGITESKVIPIYTTITNPKHTDVFRREGSEEEWVKIVKPVMDCDLARFLFYDAMTAPLLKPLGLESHTFEHTGKTSSGKSTLSRVIASAIGNPTEQLVIPASTEKGLLAHVNVMCDIPTFIEEATSTRAKQVTRSAIYEIANGMEKARAQIDGKLREDVKTFRAVTHITCEGSVREEMEHAGEMYRLNSMSEQLPRIDTIGKIDKDINNCYGFYFARYIQEVLKNKDKLKELYTECYDLIKVDENCEDRNLIERSKYLYAGIMVAGYLCEEVFDSMGMGRKDYKEIVLRYFEKCVKENHVEMDHIRALSLLNGWFSSNEMSFLHGDEVQDLKIREPFGVMKDNEIWIVEKQFTKMMKEWGFNSPANIRKELFEEGILIAKEGSNGRTTFRMGVWIPHGIKINKARMEIKLGLVGNVAK